jgi:hypothetical protein
MIDVVITFESKWIKKQTDCRKCDCCGELIYSDMYSLTVFINGEEVESEITTTCESCMNLLKDKS